MNENSKTYSPIFPHCITVGDRVSNVSGTVQEVTETTAGVVVRFPFATHTFPWNHKVMVHFGTL